ncbi:hypothetical protein [Methylobacter sp. S3L5C]|uniref:hypothetical protein n=1 Tax=Methylobacter sp. S3L5C TaxID=2839024 RepID=UPI001FAE2E4F|nr:hypothetical protein [Methylobacter sp. S3L5C]UOA10472.1 hypothetical protein KKZ03_09695 [Methylobacter sp. S3L5C]
MTSLFTNIANTEEQVVLADTIVTSVFMGLVRERLVNGYQVFIGYGGGFDPYEGSQSLGGSKKVDAVDEVFHRDLETLLRRKFSFYADQIVIGASNKWVDTSKGNRSHFPTSSFVITGAQSREQIHKDMSMKAKRLALDCLNSNTYQARNPSPLEVNKERGAYYGVADLNNGQVYGPIATTRQVYRNNSGRWMNPGQGWIFTPTGEIASGSHAAMVDTDDERYIQALGGGMSADDLVVGYCHGMIFAEHICMVSGGGTAYEISMNEQTCKNASCFGCATFMFANGMPPSWMHLGSAESWSPLPEDAGNFAYHAHFNNDRLESVAKSMNNAWTTAVARWMKEGVIYPRNSSKLSSLKSALASKNDREIAYLFLDALTIHGNNDFKRIIGMLE